MVLKRLKRELVGTAVSMDTTRETAEVDLGSRGQTKDPSKGRYLSRLYNKKSSLKIELV